MCVCVCVCVFRYFLDNLTNVLITPVFFLQLLLEVTCNFMSRSANRTDLAVQIGPGGPTQPDIQWVPDFFFGVKRPGACREPLTHISTEVKERVELYLYFFSGTLWDVPGRTLPLSLYFTDMAAAKRH